ncbi:MAG: hypothetical protein FD161_2477 [Limisphaerales bacterium]|nr:MAG: hypothetical protein FD161_2477 [Limisphaerales bacterium]KAG0508597.1 MAG: hypothetical protein E1N63_2228 [Limisphaerales bacterium]TXT48038.1 MAG: hypothetical protein FD140_3788 [Limisphaerales bacterium]
MPLRATLRVVRSFLLGGFAAAGIVFPVAEAAPPASSPLFEHLHDIPFTGVGMPMTMIHDAGSRPFLYLAAKEAGLRIYDVKDSPRLVRTIRISELGGQHVMSLAQSGQRVYLALGNHWGKRETAGLAVIDVGSPAQARVAGVWKDSQTNGAGGAVVVSGSTAFLAAMGNGVIALDAGNPAAISVKSRFVPELAFPDKRPDRAKINARGLALQKNLLFLCFDAGGVRVIDVADPGKPVEIGRYSNPAMTGRPRAYNNLVLDGSLAYVTADYVGLEILDIANPRAIKLVSWWNPWNPKPDGLRWFSSPGHANEIAYDARSKTVLMSAGRSDLVAVNVSDPARPRQTGFIGTVEDTQATWGLSLHGDLIYLSYIRTLGIPFRADWSGVKVFRYRP